MRGLMRIDGCLILRLVPGAGFFRLWYRHVGGVE
jgi:hypothetical protein